MRRTLQPRTVDADGHRLGLSLDDNSRATAHGSRTYGSAATHAGRSTHAGECGRHGDRSDTSRWRAVAGWWSRWGRQRCATGVDNSDTIRQRWPSEWFADGGRRGEPLGFLSRLRDTCTAACHPTCQPGLNRLCCIYQTKRFFGVNLSTAGADSMHAPLCVALLLPATSHSLLSRARHSPKCGTD
jgi:hypothetical protein